jgi:hypothetical protein
MNVNKIFFKNPASAKIFPNFAAPSYNTFEIITLPQVLKYLNYDPANPEFVFIRRCSCLHVIVFLPYDRLY